VGSACRQSVRDPGCELPDGWSLAQWINREIQDRFPGRITIAEDLQNHSWLTRDANHGGAGFGSQWDAGFVHPIRAVVEASRDEERDMGAVRNAIYHCYNRDVFQRVIYSESHDKAANGKSRVPTEIDPDGAQNWFAKKRSTLATSLVFTAPCIPMLFQGQEFLQHGWFQDTEPLHWNLSEIHEGIVDLHRDLIALRLNTQGVSRGLCGQGVLVNHVNDEGKVVAFHRWERGGPGDEVTVVANFSAYAYKNYRIGVPHSGLWKLRFNSDWEGYNHEFGSVWSGDIYAHIGSYDNYLNHANLSIAPYSVLIFSQPVEGE